MHIYIYIHIWSLLENAVLFEGINYDKVAPLLKRDHNFRENSPYATINSEVNVGPGRPQNYTHIYTYV